jgi:hypothetical protein
MDSIFNNTINFFCKLVNETKYIKVENEFELNSSSKFTDNDSLYTFVNRIIKMKKIYQNDTYEIFISNLCDSELNTNYITNINLIIDKNIRSENYFKNDYFITLDSKLLFDILELINIFEKKKFIYYKYICKIALCNNTNNFIKKNTQKVLQMCNYIYYLYNYYYHLINNYSRYKKGYYYSISKKKAISLCEKNRNKIYQQYNKFYLIKLEFDAYLDSFYNNWINLILQKNIEISFYDRAFKHISYYFKCIDYFNINNKLNLHELVNSNYMFINYECDIKYIEQNYFLDENYFNYKNKMDYKYENIDVDLFPIFFYFMNKKYPNMTDDDGIAYENYYVPIPILPLI